MVWDVERFNSIRISIASPEQILRWSFGEIKKPETINYRTHKPERDGLFCEKIFGPTRDWNCYCGKYKSVRYKGIICERCGVEITKSNVRRERMGHIELATPVAHIWYARGTPSYMAQLLDISPRDLEKVLYFNSYIVVDPGTLPLTKKQILSEEEYRFYFEKYGDIFRAGMGAETVRELLRELNLPVLVAELQARYNESEGRNPVLLKRLEAAKIFRDSVSRPEWMIMDQLPVIPPDLRPMVQLDGGRFATSDLNDLYRRVINRNNRLKRLLNLGAPEIIIKNEKRMLQEAVNSLIENGKRGKPVTGPGKRPLKSLNDMLKGKQGRFRQNLLGKRVDYSGRSVIVVGPSLKIHECGLPKKMALELFKPFVMHKFVATGKAHNIKGAKKLLERGSSEVWDVLEEVIRDHPVLLNRAPTLHRFGIQAFQPRLTEGKAIQIHPLVCHAFNADFDGDQMAVHIPLLAEAQAESKTLMLSAHNLFASSNGRPLVAPSQDMAIGCYFLTMAVASGNIVAVSEVKKAGKTLVSLREQLINGIIPVKAAEDIKVLKKTPRSKGKKENAPQERIIIKKNSFFDEHVVKELEQEGITEVKIIEKQVFSSREEAVYAFDTGCIGLNEKMYYLIPGNDDDSGTGRYEETTVGRVLFNDIIPEEMGFINKTFDKGELSALISRCYATCGRSKTVKLLDDMKEVGFRYATRAGLSISIKELVEPALKRSIIHEADKKSQEVSDLLDKGSISREEKRQRLVDIWMQANEEVTDDLLQAFRAQEERGEFNSVYTMATSGARGNIAQIRQLAAMRGLMSNPHGDIMDFPIKSNFREGLKLTEYFISTYGARKGLVDTALRTADSGYLTRRLVDVAQEVVISEYDCGTTEGIEIYPLREKSTLVNKIGGEVIVSLKERAISRVMAEDYRDINNGEILLKAGDEIDASVGKMIEKNEAICSVSDDIIGFVTVEPVLEPREGKVVVRADRTIDRFVLQMLEKARVEQIRVRPRLVVRSPLKCQSITGICRRCFGRDLATGNLVDIGDAAGIIAAQSIGEPGTQLTMRTFHYGGVAALEQRQYVKSKISGRISLDNLEWTLKLDRGRQSIDSEIIEGVDDAGLSEDVRKTVVSGSLEIIDARGSVDVYPLPTGAVLRVEEGDMVTPGDYLCEYNPNQVVTEIGGVVRFENISQNEGIVVTDNGVITVENVKYPGDDRMYPIAQGSYIKVKENSRVNPGDILAETVAEQKIAISGIDGRVEFFDIKVKNKRVISDTGLIYIVPAGKETAEPAVYSLPRGVKERRADDDSKYGVELKVHSGHQVRCGDELLCLSSEIEGDVHYDGKSDIIIKNNAQKEYRIPKEVPTFIDEDKMSISFVSDVAGRAEVIVEKGPGGKTADLRRIVVNEEKTYELPWDAHVTMADVRIRPGDPVQKGQKITGDISFKSGIDGTVEIIIAKSGFNGSGEANEELRNLKRKIVINDVRSLKLDKKSQVRERLRGKVLAEDVVESGTGRKVSLRGQEITDTWLAEHLLVSNLEGQVYSQKYRRVPITSTEVIEKLKGSKIALDVVNIQTGEIVIEAGRSLNGQALARLRNAREGVQDIAVAADMMVVKSETEVAINKKEPFKNRLYRKEVMRDIINPRSGELICAAGTFLNAAHLDVIDKQRMHIKKIYIAYRKEYEIKPGMTVKVKDGADVGVGTELVSPTHLESIVYIDATEEYEIPAELQFKVEDGARVRAGDVLTEPIAAIESDIDGKVNYITEYNKKSGYEIIRKITVYTGKEFVIPMGINTRVKSGDYIQPGDHLTHPVEFEDIWEEDNYLRIARTEKVEKKYKVSKDMDILVSDGQKVEPGKKLAVLKNDKLKIMNEYEERVIPDENNVFQTRYSPLYPGQVELYQDGRKKAVDEGEFTILFSTGEIHFASEPVGVWNIKYTYEATGLVKLERGSTKEGKLKTALDSIVVQAGEAHRVSDGAELLVEDTYVNLTGKLSIVDKLEGKIAMGELKNSADKAIVKSGDFITRKLAESIDKHKTQLKPGALRVVDRVKQGDILARFEAGAKKTVDIVQGLPRVAELFEIRRPKNESMIADGYGVIQLTGNMISLKTPEGDVRHLKTRLGTAQLFVDDGAIVHKGDRLSEGNVFPKKLMEVGGSELVQKYIADEVQYVYQGQGVRIHDKHIEVIVRQMLRKVEIDDPGNTDFLPDELVHVNDLNAANEAIIKDGGRPASGKIILQGITKAALTTKSFISAASFQETTRVLTRAAVKGQIDRLSGLKENLIIGKLIPAGTGLDCFRDVKIIDDRREVSRLSENEDSDEEVLIHEDYREAEQALERSGS